MNELSLQDSGSLLLLLHTACWILGGWLIAVHAFNLQRREQAMVGVGLGLVITTWIANFLAQVLPVLYAFWLAPLIVLGLGLALSWPLSKDMFFRRISLSLPQWFILGLLTALFTAIGRGLAIFDDFQNLPTVSIMATGDIPPRFPLNPDLRFGYHYFLLLVASGLMRVGQIYPWTALDLVHGITLALVLILGFLWALRLTHNRVAAFLSSVFLAFSSGTRWLLLLFPHSLVRTISDNITLLGTGAQSGPNLSASLLLTWKLEGDGPIPFPFAFSNGVNIPLFMTHHGIGAMAVLIVMLLLFTYGHWRHWSTSIITTILLAALALANEVFYVLLVLGFAIAFIISSIDRKSIHIPRTFVPLISIIVLSGFLAIIQGGMFTEIVRSWIERRLTGVSSSFFNIEFIFVWPPSVVSAHLGILSLGNLAQFITALFEIGPVVLVLPLVIVWGLKRLKGEHWFEAGLVGTAVVSLGTIFIQYSGSRSISNTTRLLDGLLFICKLYSVPLLWIWVRHRSEKLKIGLVVLGMVATFGGIVLFGIELIAIQKPVISTFITDMDVKMEQKYWNRLKPGALIFDPLPTRATTVFGRQTKSSLSWVENDPDWEALVEAPDPYLLNATGYDYMYFDKDFWKDNRDYIGMPCVRVLHHVIGAKQQYKGIVPDFRELVDISACH